MNTTTTPSTQRYRDRADAPEPVQVIVTVPLGAAIKLIGKDLRTGQAHELILSPEQMATLQVSHPAG